MDTLKFINRHIGPRENDVPKMLETIGVQSIDELIEQTIPAHIRLKKPLDLPEGISEAEYLRHIKSIASKNKIFKN